ncbi:hypothetical protein [Shewanella sp. HL-SH2]|uniref:hypothetical protein n=1 Tax=Shewanella sp. HL-SH2 TaxID=3436238 RepID=UPI003EB79549
MDILNLSDKEFCLFQRMIYEIAGINLSENKKALVSSRLAKRVKHFGLNSYTQYFELLQSKSHNEYQIAIDLLTTHETFSFASPNTSTLFEISLSQLGIVFITESGAQQVHPVRKLILWQ